MKPIEFRIQGSAADPYVVSISQNDHQISIHCTCPAGQKNQLCKHRLRIIAGNTEGIVSGNKSEVALVHSLVEDTEIWETIKKIDNCQLMIENEQSKLKKLKKKLARIIQ